MLRSSAQWFPYHLWQGDSICQQANSIWNNSPGTEFHCNINLAVTRKPAGCKTSRESPSWGRDSAPLALSTVLTVTCEDSIQQCHTEGQSYSRQTSDQQDQLSLLFLLSTLLLKQYEMELNYWCKILKWKKIHRHHTNLKHTSTNILSCCKYYGLSMSFLFSPRSVAYVSAAHYFNRYSVWTNPENAHRQG